MPYSTLKLCSSGGAYEAAPQPRLKIDLTDAKQRLEAEGLSVVDARVLLLVSGDPEVTLSRDGRILVKTQDRALADATFQRFLRLLRLD
jgi:hypothetical protein